MKKILRRYTLKQASCSRDSFVNYKNTPHTGVFFICNFPAFIVYSRGTNRRGFLFFITIITIENIGITYGTRLPIGES